MNAKDFREMQPREREIFRQLLAPAFPGRDALVEQLETAMVKAIDDDGSMEISVSSNVCADSVKARVPAEGEYEDLDGVTVHVLLHVLDGKALELEFYKDDSSAVRTWPSPGAFRALAPE